MKVTQVAIRPTEDSNAAGRPALTPELLAATGARYSRNNEGLEAILSRIDPNNLDKSVDSIFRMIDYGHQSIADMVPAALFIDGISVWLAYTLWSLCPTAGGQESSTRYIRYSLEELIAPEILGIPEDLRPEWTASMQECFAAFNSALEFWEARVARSPEEARIPRSLLDDPSEKVQRQVARMKRNYSFDRARYFLPAAVSTNVMMIMSARGWVQLLQNLLSHDVLEARALGEAIRDELKLSAPRMLRHAVEKESIRRGIQHEFDMTHRAAVVQEAVYLREGAPTFEHPDTAYLELLLPHGVTESHLCADLEFHDNRYAWIGPELRRTAVRFGWEAVALAEIRDLTRHRTGTRTCSLIPVGFYCAQDQVGGPGASVELDGWSQVGRRASAAARARLESGHPDFVYWVLMGAQFPFEHVTTADKFIYEAELRTGTGAHYRYARHLHDALALWYDRFPGTRGLILEGAAEPE